MEPLVSVVMPVYNSEMFLREAVNSILTQSYRQLELIVVNDGSTDVSAAILSSIEDKRIRVLEHERNQGITQSLNDAIAVSTGEYICRMDADDVAVPHRIERQVAFLEEHPDIALVGTGTVLIDKDGTRIGQESYPESAYEIRREIFVHNPFAHSAVMIRKSVLDRCGFYDARFLHNEDYDLWLRIVAAYPAANLRDRLLLRRVHGANITVAKETELILYRRRTLAHAMKEYYHKPFYIFYLIRPFAAYWWCRLRGLVQA